MSEPVHEVQHLRLHPSAAHGPGPDSDAGRGRGMALPPPEDPAFTQALHLSACPGGDWLLGRQDSGMAWLWDLSQRLGWADGSRPGSWLLRGSGVGSAKGQQHWLDESDWDAVPLALGCLPAPYECWSGGDAGGGGGGAGPLHYLPREAAWVAGPGIVGLVGLDLEHKQALFPRHAAGAYPSNALAVCGLRAVQARDADAGG